MLNFYSRGLSITKWNAKHCKNSCEKKIISRTIPGSMISLSFLIYNSIQANPVVGCVIYDRPYRSFYRPSCHLWCPAKIRRSHLRYCLAKDAYWRAAVEIWTQRTDLPTLGKQGEEPGILLGMGLSMKQRQRWCIERVLEEKDNFLGTEIVKGNLLSQETVIYFADLRVKIKSCRVFCASVGIHKQLRGTFHQIMLFSCYLSNKTFLSSFPVF